MDRLIPRAQYFGLEGTRGQHHSFRIDEWCRGGEPHPNQALAVSDKAATTLGLIYVANSAELPNRPDERAGRGQIP